MKKDYHHLPDLDKLRYWESVLAHKIRVQAESGGDPGSAITPEFIGNCRRQEPRFDDFIPALGMTFPVLNRYAGKKGLGTLPDPMKKTALVFSAVVFFGIQILLIVKTGAKGLIFAGIVNGIMGAVYAAGVRINVRIKGIYRELAEITGLEFTYTSGGIPGFLYNPGLAGWYNGFRVTLDFENRWTGRWSWGQNGLGQAQTAGRSTLKIDLPGKVSGDVHVALQEALKKNQMKGKLVLADRFIGYEISGAVNSEVEKDDLLLALKRLTEILFSAA